MGRFVFPLQFRLDERCRERDRALKEIARRLRRRRRHRVFLALRIANNRIRARRIERERDHFTPTPGVRKSARERLRASRRLDSLREELEAAERHVAARRGGVRKLDHDVEAARARLLRIEMRIDALSSMRNELEREHRRVRARKEARGREELERIRYERQRRTGEGREP